MYACNRSNTTEKSIRSHAFNASIRSHTFNTSIRSHICRPLNSSTREIFTAEAYARDCRQLQPAALLKVDDLENCDPEHEKKATDISQWMIGHWLILGSWPPCDILKRECTDKRDSASEAEFARTERTYCDWRAARRSAVHCSVRRETQRVFGT